MKTKLFFVLLCLVITIHSMYSQEIGVEVDVNFRNNKEVNAKNIETDINGIKIKNPALAFGASLLFPGFGQFYNEQKTKGIIMGSLALSSYITHNYTMYNSNNSARTLNHISLGVILGTYAWSLIDAPISSNIANSPFPNALQHQYRSPFGASVLSFFVPGLGQFYNGQTGKGIIMSSTFAASYLLLFRGMMMSEYASNRLTPMNLSLIAILVNHIWSPIDAYHSAKSINRRNQALGWNIGNDFKLSVTPNIIFANSIGTKTDYKSPAYGLSLKLSF